MIDIRKLWRRMALGLVLLLALVVVLAACGGDDGGDTDQEQSADETPVVGDGGMPDTSQNTPAPPATQELLPTLTPYLAPDEPVFQEASEDAKIALATEMTLSLDDLDVLEPDAVLYLEEPLLCPALEAETAGVYYVYVQHDELIYAYQVVPSATEGEEPLVQRCEDVFVDDDVLYVPDENPRSAPVDSVTADLAERGIDPAAGRITSVTKVRWTDEALGCPRGAGIEDPATASIEGYRIIFMLDDEPYEYHTDATGDRVVYCAPPPGFDTAQAFIDMLLEQEDELDAEVLPAEQEVAAYEGLDAEGAVVEMMLEGDRIGVFGFESEEAAVAAAREIDDPFVSHIFVSGKVLIVQEENNLSIYSLLLDHAREVRNVAEERLREDGGGLYGTGDDEDAPLDELDDDTDSE